MSPSLAPRPMVEDQSTRFCSCPPPPTKPPYGYNYNPSTSPPFSFYGRITMAFFDSTTSGVIVEMSAEEVHRERMHSLVCKELGASIQKAHSSWLDSLFCDISTPSAIEEYLHGKNEYRRGRWTRIPESPTAASELLAPFCETINSISQHLLLSERPCTRETTISQLNEEAAADIVIRATGPSFSTPSSSSPGFSNVAGCVSVRLDSESDELWSRLAHLMDWAKNIFIAQPNRFFVRSMVVTERKAQIFHFDRSGVQYSRMFNIHRKPETFIRLILGLCTSQERVIGLDDTIQWVTSTDGAKINGFVKTVGPDAVPTTYTLVTDEPPLIRTNLLGRGTTCWNVTNDRGERLIIKDYWVVDSPGKNLPAEFDLLEEVKGLHGVCEMISYEDNRAQTRDFRGDTSTFPSSSFQNRKHIRIVMKAYGPSIENFTSLEQLLGALRDAISAHRVLVSKNIIHRDISPNNILLRGSDVDEGPQAILIDLDHALRMKGLATEARVDFKTGTRMFQSAMVLKSSEMDFEYIPLYDYIDDLEAFFWVLFYFILSFKPNGDRMPRNGYQERTLRGWSQLGAGIAHDVKYGFLLCPSNLYVVRKMMDPGWQIVYDDVFLGFRAFVRDIFNEKQLLLYTSCTELPDGTFAPSRFEPILAKIDDHYNHILALFDNALAKIGGSTLPAVPEPLPTVGPASTSICLTTSAPHTLSSLSVAPSATAVDKATPLEDTKAVSSPSSTSKSSASLENPPSPASRPKRRREEAEIDDESPNQSKRICAPGRRQFRGILGSAYNFCRALLFE